MVANTVIRPRRRQCGNERYAPKRVVPVLILEFRSLTEFGSTEWSTRVHPEKAPPPTSLPTILLIIVSEGSVARRTPWA